jgi:hypothetical protein
LRRTSPATPPPRRVPAAATLLLLLLLLLLLAIWCHELRDGAALLFRAPQRSGSATVYGGHLVGHVSRSARSSSSLQAATHHVRAERPR